MTQPQACDEEQQTRSQIAEHHAVHNEEAHRDDQRRIQLVVRRDPKSRHELFERLQPARTSNKGGDALTICVGLENLHRDRMAGSAFDSLSYSVPVDSRYPTRNQEDFAVFGETPDGFREFSAGCRPATQATEVGRKLGSQFLAFTSEMGETILDLSCFALQRSERLRGPA